MVTIMKKSIKLLLFSIFWIVVMFLLNFIYPNYLPTLFGGLLKVAFYYHILIFLLAYFLVVMFHELAHALAFIFKGVKLKMILILIFLFHKTKRWHLSIDPRLIILGGGMVMPDFERIESESDIIFYKKAISFSLLFAPIFTIVSSVVLTLMNLLFFYDVPMFTVISFYILLFSMFFTYTSTLQAQGIYGDFIAYKKVMTDPIFGLSIISQFMDDITLFHYDYVRTKLLEEKPSDFSIHLLNFYTLLLEKGIYDDNDIDKELLEKTKVLATSPHIVRRISRQYKLIEVIQQAILYLYRCQEDGLVDQLLPMYFAEIEKMAVKDTVKEYYRKQINHYLGRVDEREYLSEKRDIHHGLMGLILSHLPEYQDIENEHLEPIERFEKKEMIHLDNLDSM